MERSIKHWYYSDWNDQEDPVTVAETDAGPWVTQSVAGCQSQDVWSRAPQTALSTFGGDGGPTTPRRCTVEDGGHQSTAVAGARRPSCGSDHRWTAVADGADPDRGCYVVAVHSDREGDVGEQCCCQNRALGAQFDKDAGTTSRNADRTVPADDGPCSAASKRVCTDLVDGWRSSLNRKPKMVVKPNCDQAVARYRDSTASGLLRTGSASLDGDDRITADCGGSTAVLNSVPVPSSSVVARPSTLPTRFSRSTSTPSAGASLQRTTYAPRLFFADTGGSRAHGNAAVYRAGSYRNGFVGDGEKCAINRPSATAAHTTSYGCGRDQVDRRISASGPDEIDRRISVTTTSTSEFSFPVEPDRAPGFHFRLGPDRPADFRFRCGVRQRRRGGGRSRSGSSAVRVSVIERQLDLSRGRLDDDVSGRRLSRVPGRSPSSLRFVICVLC